HQLVSAWLPRDVVSDAEVGYQAVKRHDRRLAVDYLLSLRVHLNPILRVHYDSSLPDEMVQALVAVVGHGLAAPEAQEQQPVSVPRLAEEAQHEGLAAESVIAPAVEPDVGFVGNHAGVDSNLLQLAGYGLREQLSIGR